MSASTQEHLAETIVGALVLAVAAAFLGFALTGAGDGGRSDGYALQAGFDRADGVGVGTDVRLAGVKVGAVSAVRLDTDTYRAKVTLTIDPAVKVPDDSEARISADGLLGGAFVAIEPGVSETMMPANGEFLDTRGSVDLLALLAAAGRNASQGGSTPAPDAEPR